VGGDEKRNSEVHGLLFDLSKGKNRTPKTRRSIATLTHTSVEMRSLTMDFIVGMPRTSKQHAIV